MPDTIDRPHPGAAPLDPKACHACEPQKNRPVSDQATLDGHLEHAGDLRAPPREVRVDAVILEMPD